MLVLGIQPSALLARSDASAAGVAHGRPAKLHACARAPTPCAQVVFVREGVAVWPSRTERIMGRLSLVKQHCVLFMAWLPYSRGTLQEDGTFKCTAVAAAAHGSGSGTHDASGEQQPVQHRRKLVREPKQRPPCCSPRLAFTYLAT